MGEFIELLKLFQGNEIIYLERKSVLIWITNYDKLQSAITNNSDLKNAKIIEALYLKLNGYLNHKIQSLELHANKQEHLTTAKTGEGENSLEQMVIIFKKYKKKLADLMTHSHMDLTQLECPEISAIDIYLADINESIKSLDAKILSDLNEMEKIITHLRSDIEKFRNDDKNIFMRAEVIKMLAKLQTAPQLTGVSELYLIKFSNESYAAANRTMGSVIESANAIIKSLEKEIQRHKIGHPLQAPKHMFMPKEPKRADDEKCKETSNPHFQNC